jgi:hypothetical protein
MFDDFDFKNGGSIQDGVLQIFYVFFKLWSPEL